MITDIHSHREAPYPEGVICLDLSSPVFDETQLYSVGVHPWDTVSEIDPALVERVRTLASLPNVAAIGEAGIDTLKGGPMFRQLQQFKMHVEISEETGKPLVIHAVKADDIIMGLHRDLNPSQPWIMHGYRGKPQPGRQLTDKGIYLSFGEKFNAETLRCVPREFILAETDESPLPIREIIDALSESAGTDLLPVIAKNSETVIHRQAQAH